MNAADGAPHAVSIAPQGGMVGVRRGVGALAVLLSLLALVRLLFPGDIAFIADEPVLIDRALDALESGTIPLSGLQGTRGVPYGPLATWFYQFLLVFTSDLRWVAVAKIVVVSGLSGLALVLLASSVSRLTPVLGAFAFLSPYLWFYARDLWDNSFTTPFSAMLLAAYARYLASGRERWLALTVLFGAFCLLTHFMTVPVVSAVAVHFLVTRRRRLVREPRFTLRLAAMAGGALALCLPYFVRLFPRTDAHLLWSPSPRSLLFAFDGFRLSSLLGFDYVIGPWSAGGAGPVLRVLSAFTYVVGAYGLYRLDGMLREGRPWAAVEGRAPPPPETTEVASEVEASPGDAGTGVAAVMALTLVFWVILANGERLSQHPHYHSGVWIVFFLLWWLGMSDLVNRAWARRTFYVQAAAMAVFLPSLVFWLHGNRGTRSLHYGPTLENQMAVARELDELGVADIPPSRAVHPRLFPQAIRVLRRLHARGEGGIPARVRPAEDFEIVYEGGDGDGGGAIGVRRVADGEP